MPGYEFEQYENGVDVDDLFDWAVFGALVRQHRKRMGYKTAEAFSESIYNRTRFSISAETLYKIEGGKQMPNGMQLLSLLIALGLEPFKSPAGRILTAASGKEWESVGTWNEVPEKWRRENSCHYALEYSGFPDCDSAEWYRVCHSDECPEHASVLYCPEYETAFAEDIAEHEAREAQRNL